MRKAPSSSEEGADLTRTQRIKADLSFEDGCSGGGLSCKRVALK
jgi:hypothetical protein